jgi:hypothetical protein
MERQSNGSRGLEVDCEGGKGPRRAVGPPKKKKKNKKKKKKKEKKEEEEEKG